MNFSVAYHGRSSLANGGASQSLTFAPNLKRDPVAFDAALKFPLRFREAVSALHDVVVSDLRFKPRDKTAHDEWKRNEQRREAAIHRAEYQRVKQEILGRVKEIPAELETSYNQCLRRYWKVRQSYANILLKHDPDLWRMLMPCDPVVTVGADVVFFECFSADESSYGCLTVERDGGFGTSEQLQLGTTNVDYSWHLYDHFQALRSYRETRLKVDPTGFEVATETDNAYREEKIDLPEGWLRGFMRIQQAMSLPMRRVSLSREAVYSTLAWYKRHKARKSPRALRFELLPDRSPQLVLEPWEKRIVSRDTKYQGPSGEPIRIWGTRRLLSLARLLPLADRFDVYLLGTGLPSFWVARMGEMRLTLGLSGWTTNDWTRGSALDLLAPPAQPSKKLVGRAAEIVRSRQAVAPADLAAQLNTTPATCTAALGRLAHAGQVIFDLNDRVVRWRQVMPMALGEAEMGPENAELVDSRRIVASRRVSLESDDEAPGRGRVYVGKADGKPVELAIDADGRIRRGRCPCAHHRRAGMRMGPCRHLLALRQFAGSLDDGGDASSDAWYDRIRSWASP